MPIEPQTEKEIFEKLRLACLNEGDGISGGIPTGYNALSAQSCFPLAELLELCHEHGDHTQIAPLKISRIAKGKSIAFPATLTIEKVLMMIASPMAKCRLLGSTQIAFEDEWTFGSILVTGHDNVGTSRFYVPFLIARLWALKHSPR